MCEVPVAGRKQWLWRGGRGPARLEDWAWGADSPGCGWTDGRASWAQEQWEPLRGLFRRAGDGGCGGWLESLWCKMDWKTRTEFRGLISEGTAAGTQVNDAGLYSGAEGREGKMWVDHDLYVRVSYPTWGLLVQKREDSKCFASDCLAEWDGSGAIRGAPGGRFGRKSLRAVPWDSWVGRWLGLWVKCPAATRAVLAKNWVTWYISSWGTECWNLQNVDILLNG